MVLGVRGLVSSMLVGSVDRDVMLVVVVVSVVVAPSMKLIDEE
jgi:hypothetical protein